MTDASSKNAASSTESIPGAMPETPMGANGPMPGIPPKLPAMPSILRSIILPVIIYILCAAALTVIGSMQPVDSSPWTLLVNVVAGFIVIGPFFTLAVIVIYIVRRSKAKRAIQNLQQSRA